MRGCHANEGTFETKLRRCSLKYKRQFRGNLSAVFQRREGLQRPGPGLEMIDAWVWIIHSQFEIMIAQQFGIVYVFPTMGLILIPAVLSGLMVIKKSRVSS